MKAPRQVILVVTSVHPPDDPRVRERTVRVLATRAPVRYATRLPGPTDRSDHEWVPLAGGRIRRMAGVMRAAWAADVRAVSVHDPELLPVAFAVRLLRRRGVVFDVHEDVPSQIADKDWLPRPVRKPAAGLAKAALRVAEHLLTITLAEAGYARLFRNAHPVLPNYPDVDTLPPPQEDERRIVYVGDIQPMRGAELAVAAVGGMKEPLPLHMVGRCAPALQDRLRAQAAEAGVELHLHGFLPHPRAMELAAGSTVGLSPLMDVANYRWSLPTKVIEYLALGVAVAASNLPGTSEVINNMPGAQLLPPGSVAAWSRALDDMCHDPRWRREAAENAAAVRSRFVWPAADVLRTYGVG